MVIVPHNTHNNLYQNIRPIDLHTGYSDLRILAVGSIIMSVMCSKLVLIVSSTDAGGGGVVTGAEEQRAMHAATASRARNVF